MGCLLLGSLGNASQFIPRSRDQRNLSLVIQRNPHLKLHELKQIQAQVLRRYLHQDNILITKLVSICSASGIMDYATHLFNFVQEPDLVLCNSMLKGYTGNCLSEQALLFYVQLLQMGLYPDNFTLPYVLKACASISSISLGKQIHAYIMKSYSLTDDVFVLNSLLNMYFKSCHGEFAMQVFRQISEPDLTSWNIMINGFLSLGDFMSARKLFDAMSERDTVSWNTMITAYAKHGETDDARKLFDEMPERNLVSWNAFIVGLSQNGLYDEAVLIFSQMLESRIEPDNTTLLLVASAVSKAISPDSQAVEEIINFERSANSVSVSKAVLNLYAKLGRIDDARALFDEIPERDLVSWNAMIAGYSQNQRPVEAIKLFREMQLECSGTIEPDRVTMVSLISSCSQMGALGLGEWVHAYIEKNGIELDLFLATALVDMYSKCGDLDQALHLFQEMPKRDLASYNAMIKGLAIHGQVKEALSIFSLMEKTKAVPNGITFLGLLNACSHGGMVSKGLELFNLMQSLYGIVPWPEHYGCVVDLIARAGRLDDAYEFVKSMPIEPDKAVWGALLGACHSHQNVQLAEEVACKLLDLDPSHDGNYVLLSNVYASQGKWGDVEKVRTHMRTLHVQKTPGCSMIELGGVVHEFSAGDRSHPRSEDIYAAWDELAKKIKPMGYEADMRVLLRNLDEEDREEALYRHSEKLALAFALINSESKAPVRIIKNLRICTDCHKAMELVSKLEERVIIVRDRTRFHHFKAGYCSCGGYW